LVNIGFICEGATEKLLVDSVDFNSFVETFNCKIVASVDAGGNGNLLPKNITPFILALKSKGSEFIFILSDLDADLCITLTKERISAPADLITVIAVKTIESWFLADSALLSKLCGEETHIDFPEEEIKPFEAFRRIINEKAGRGIGFSKLVVAKKIISKGFSMNSVLKHPNCQSAQYFFKKLKGIEKKS